MPKPINETVGRCLCRHKDCDQVADVRRSKGHEHGAPYLVCPDHGVDRAHGPAAQAKLAAWIEQHATWGEGAPPTQEPPPQEPKETPAPPRPGFFATASADLDKFMRE